jgi:hypothetical protein
MTQRILPMLVLLLVVFAGTVHAQVTPPPATVRPPQTPAAATPAAPVDYVFPTGAGMLLFHVAPAKVADFDAVLTRLKVALSQADTAPRTVQAANWLIYKSAEKPAAAADPVVYLFLFDPAVTTANYDPLLLLAEMLPAEVQRLYDRLKAAVVKVERMGLTKVR